MRIQIVGSLVLLLGGAAVALAQSEAAPAPAPRPPSPEVSSAGHPAPVVADCSPPASGMALTEPLTTACSPDDCSCLKKLYPAGHTWVSAEYLLWWLRGQSTPALVTTGPGTAPPAQFGVLGVPGTQVLFGGKDLDYSSTNGLRLMAGIQGPGHLVGIEGGAFVLEQRVIRQSFTSDAAGNPVIARPFFDQTGVGARTLTSGPGVFSGALEASTSSRLWGGEVNVTKAAFGLLNDCSSIELDLIGGIRYLDLSERLSLAQRSTILPNGVSAFGGNFLFAPTEIDVADSFAARNQFFGGQIGAALEFQYCHFFFYAVGKVGFGVNHETLNINGSSTAITPGGPTTTLPGGLLALPSNIGGHGHDTFAAVPEVDLNIGYQLNRHLRFFVGYDFLYWGDVVRPGNQVSNLRLSVGQIPTSPAFGTASNPTLPVSNLHHSDYWAHGLNAGMAFHF